MLGTPRLSFRRFQVLLQNLPEDSRFRDALTLRAKHEAKGGEASKFDELEGIAHWPMQDQLLAMQVDLLALANWQRGGGKGRRPQMLSAGSKRSGRPSQGIDVRKTLRRGAPLTNPANPEEPPVSQ